MPSIHGVTSGGCGISLSSLDFPVPDVTMQSPNTHCMGMSGKYAVRMRYGQWCMPQLECCVPAGEICEGYAEAVPD